MAGRASIVGAAETSVGKVREHNEDAHFIDPEAGIFIVCDGMGGHAAGEVASAIAVKTIRAQWSGNDTANAITNWLAEGTANARKQLIQTLQQGVIAAHEAIVAESEADRGKSGMGTTLVGAMVVGGDVMFAHCGDSRAYLVRDGIAMQLTEDHTLLARLLAAGVDVDVDGDGARFRSMLTNALGIGHECKVSTFVVPVADGDRFLLCSDGITEYVQEHEIGEVLSTMPSPARSAQRLVEMALQRGGGDNATALVVRVLEAGETSRPPQLLKREEQAIHACPLWAKVNPQQRLRALRIALPRDYPEGDKLPAQTLGDRVAWIIVEGELEQDGYLRGPGSLLYPEALLGDRPLPDKDGLAVCQSEVRGLALRSDDFRELCDDDPELGQALLDALATEIQLRRPRRRTGKIVVDGDGADPMGDTGAGYEETLPPTRPEVPASVADASVADASVADARAAGASVADASVADASVADARVADAPVADATSADATSAANSADAPKPRARRPTNPGVAPPARAPTIPPPMRERAATVPPLPDLPEPPARLSSPRLHARGSTPPLIAPALDVAGDLDRALDDIQPPRDVEGDLERALSDLSDEEPKQLAPADDEDAEIVVEGPEREPPPVRQRADAAKQAQQVSEPEISIEQLEDEAEAEANEAAADDGAVIEILKDTSSQKITMGGSDASDPEIVVEPLVAADSEPNPPRAKRQSDGWD